jgi:hypothetical protein
VRLLYGLIYEEIFTSFGELSSVAHPTTLKKRQGRRRTGHLGVARNPNLGHRIRSRHFSNFSPHQRQHHSTYAPNEFFLQTKMAALIASASGMIGDGCDSYSSSGVEIDPSTAASAAAADIITINIFDSQGESWTAHPDSKRVRDPKT